MFDWKQYITLANELFKVPIEAISSECRLRNCVSRAYYGAYGETRKFCQEKGIFSSTGSAEDHDRLVKACHAQSNFDYKKIGSNLEWLRTRRNYCDYDDDLQKSIGIKNTIYDVADKALERADEVCKLLANIQGQSP
jgi:hypothetical protein